VQVILLRELSAAFYGVDLVYLLALGAWLLWTAAGALLGRGSLRPSEVRLRGVLVAIGITIPLDVALVRRLRLLLGGVPGAFLPLPAQIAASILCLLPASLLLGLLFQWAAKRYLSESGVRTPESEDRSPKSGVERQPSLARAYAIESVGGVVGGLVTTLTLHWGVGNLTLALVAAGLAFAAGLTLRHSRFRFVHDVAAVAGLLACFAAGWNAHRLDLWTTSWNHSDVVDVADSPYGRVTITARAGQVSAFENDALGIDSEGTEPEDFAHLSMMQHPAPRRVLVVSGAAAGLLPYVAQHRPERIDDVDLNEPLVDMLRRHLPASFAAALSSPTVHITFEDPRRAIARPGAGYDLIVVAAAEPASAQANRFFTREFFEQCAVRLSPGGVVAFRLSSIENLWTRPLIARTGSIYRALGEVFTDVVVLPGGTNIVLASRAPLTRDPDVLAARLADRDIRARLVTARYVRYLYSNDRYAEIERLLRQYPARPNTDANAASYQATAILWLSKFAPSLGQVDLARVAAVFSWSRVGSWLLVAAAGALALAWRVLGWPRRSLLVGLAALDGMMLETLLLVHYQLKHGVMFQNLGLLLMSVMGGLAAGAWAADRLAQTQAPRLTRLAAAANGGRVLVAAFVVVAFCVSISVRTGRASGLVSISLMLFAIGVLVAAVFSRASFSGDDQRRLVSPLYAADVLGGSIGSGVCSLLLIPLLGLPLTAEWTAALMAVAIILA
jgi:spermidine synthase